MKMLWYLSSPYSKYAQGRDVAYKESCRAAAELIRRGEIVFAPIAMSHSIAEHGGIDPYDYRVWMEQDEAILSECDGLIALMMPGWEESVGMRAEIEICLKRGKPIRYMSWPMLLEKIPYVDERQGLL